MGDKDDRIDELERQIAELRRDLRDTAIDRPRPGENAYERVDRGGDGDETQPNPDGYRVAYDDGDLPADDIGDDPETDDLPRDDENGGDEIDYADIGPTGMKGPNGQGSVSLDDVKADPPDSSDDELPDDLPSDGDDERGRSERGRRPRGRKPR
jgi:hypothetical protein